MSASCVHAVPRLALAIGGTSDFGLAPLLQYRGDVTTVHFSEADHFRFLATWHCNPRPIGRWLFVDWLRIRRPAHSQSPCIDDMM
jgi:hypothetical protein